MGKIAFVFPGQGAQTVGMGKDVYEHVPESRKVFNEANEALGFQLTNLIFDGPEDQLKLTYHTQPALLATSLALFAALKPLGIQADYMAGHSLGEYSALTVAGALSFRDAVRIVHERGRLMDEAVPAGLGGMAAVLGAERGALQHLCDRITDEVGLVEMANVNCPGQIVVSGTLQGVRELVSRGKEAGAKRVIPLEVSGPFHSSLMQPAADGLDLALQAVPIAKPSTPVIANVSAQPVSESERIRTLLVEQVVQPVLWEDTIEYLIRNGVDVFIEIGPGNVLSGLIKKTNREVRTYSVSGLASIEALKQEDVYVNR